MTDHEQILRKAAVEIRAANINGWGNACEQGADRIRELEAALLKIDANILLDKYEYRRIAHAALASTLETFAESKQPDRYAAHHAECQWRRFEGQAICNCADLTKVDLSSPPSIATRNEMREILGLDPLRETAVNAWVCRCGLTVKKGYACVGCFATEDLTVANRQGKA